MNSGDNKVQEKIILSQNFISEVLKEIIMEIDKNLKKKNLFAQWLKSGKYSKIKNNLDSLNETVLLPLFRDLTTTSFDSLESKDMEKNLFNTEISTSFEHITPSIKSKMAFEDSDESEYIRKSSAIMLRDFSISKYLEDIKGILETVGIEKVLIFLDDFSELEKIPQEVFVNVILAPLNNWSTKFFRFKVACYPDRIYYGEIDKTKIDEIYLDYYDLYKGIKPELNEIEEKSRNFLDRLLSKRFGYYLNDRPSNFFKIDANNNWEDYLEQLFFATMNIPRILGYLLDYTYEKSLVYGNLITKQIISEASKHYYETKINIFFIKGTIVLETYNSRLDRYGQKLLTEQIVNEAKEKNAS